MDKQIFGKQGGQPNGFGTVKTSNTPWGAHVQAGLIPGEADSASPASFRRAASPRLREKTGHRPQLESSAIVAVTRRFPQSACHVLSCPKWLDITRSPSRGPLRLRIPLHRLETARVGTRLMHVRVLPSNLGRSVSGAGVLETARFAFGSRPPGPAPWRQIRRPAF